MTHSFSGKLITDEGRVLPASRFFEVFDRLERTWPVPSSSYAGTYGWIPYSAEKFMRSLAKVETLPRLRAEAVPSFIDIGCGIGSKMGLARCFGWQASGIEIDRRMAQTAQLANPESEVWTADALTWEGDYGWFDVLYSFRIFVSQEEQWKLEERVFKEAASGAIIFWPHRVALEEFGLDSIDLALDLWRKP